MNDSKATLMSSPIPILLVVFLLGINDCMQIAVMFIFLIHHGLLCFLIAVV